MKGISVNLGDEEAVFYWKEGKVYTEGYDLESEKALLALTGYGTGIGVLLVAMNTCCENEKEFMSELKAFVGEHKRILSKQYTEWPKGQLLFEYFSYSPDPSIRWNGMFSARLSERHYKRMLNDPEGEMKIHMANLNRLPEKYFYILLNTEDRRTKYNMASNINCPSDVLEILARDKDLGIGWCVAENPACTERILEILAQDDDAMTRWQVAKKSKCTESLLELLSRDTNKSVREAAGKTLAKKKDLGV